MSYYLIMGDNYYESVCIIDEVVPSYWRWASIPSRYCDGRFNSVIDDFTKYRTRFQLLLSYAKHFKYMNGRKILREKEFRMMKELLK